MTDSSMNFGPAWIRNLDSSSTGGGPAGTTTTTRYQLAEYRYGREEMLALFDKSVKPPSSLTTFKTLYSEQTQVPLALVPTTEEEQRGWQMRPSIASGTSRGRGGSLERGGRISRGRGGYQVYGRAASAYDSGWGNGEQPDWSPRKDFNQRPSMDNWRRVSRTGNDEDDGWRSIPANHRPGHEKWTRSTSWRGEGDTEERNGPPSERPIRSSWNDNGRGGGPMRRSWDNEDYLPEWATENPTEGGGTFDEKGAFHGSDDEQDGKLGHKRDMLQKSTSQQHITHKSNNVAALTSSKSATSLSKPDNNSDKLKEDLVCDQVQERNEEFTSAQNEKVQSNLPPQKKKDDKLETNKPLLDNREKLIKASNFNVNEMQQDDTNLDKDEDFDRLQEDFLLKLVVDEDTPKPLLQPPQSSTNNFDVGGQVQPPPNLAPMAIEEKWYYQDPQGTRQGPFLSAEMAEWYKAGYFSNHLNVMRDCDERYCLLGELISLSGGENPFSSNFRFPILKNDSNLVTKPPEDIIPYQLLSQLAFKQQVAMRNLTEPWSALTIQQQEMAAQRILMQQQPPPQPPIPHDLPFMPPAAAANAAHTNPLMFMINQMQQSNKLPSSVMVDKASNNVPNQLDPLLVQMSTLHNLPNRLQNPNVHNHIPTGVVPANISSLPPDGLSGLSAGNSIPSAAGLHARLPNPVDRSPADSLPTVAPQNSDNDPLTNFLKQFQQPQRQMQFAENLWQKQNQFNMGGAPNAIPTAPTPNQWPQPPDSTPISMWDLQPPVSAPLVNDNVPLPPVQNDKQQKQEKEDMSLKEVKKRKELEEKQAKKDAEERRKQEQRKQEAEKRAAEDKRKKDEEKMRKELEKAKKEAEEKRLRELDEKRRLKEQRKAEEEARKKSEEVKKIEMEEKQKREARERDERNKADALRAAAMQQTNQSHVAAAVRAAAKTAPWSQSNSTQGMSLSEIQKAEKEKRAQEVLMMQKQQQQMQEQQQHQQQNEKSSSGLQLNWANKQLEPRKVKSLAEIQAEEQERLAKMAAEARLAAQLKEKEAPVQTNTGSIWNGQSLTWANATSTSSQWSSSNTAGGFWDSDVSTKNSTKPSTTVSKSNSTSAMTTSKPPPPQQQQQMIQQQQQQQKQQVAKNKGKKEDTGKAVNNNNNQSKDEFTDWCYKTLANISANVDIPEFVTFLRDIESAYDVRDYCKEYLGENTATQQFATNFLEKRRSFKPKNNAHKDDMCIPAPAITPSMQHNNTEFQEVKGKNKKNKKSKMLKVDSRILGFNVTSAPDRINVGDRDYGDNS